MSKQLIYTNQSERESLQYGYDAAKDATQAVVDVYNEMELDPLTEQEFPRLFTDTEVLVFDKITGGTLTLQGVQLDKAKALEIVVKPSGYSSLIAAIENLRTNAREQGFGTFRFDIRSITGYFKLTSGTTVTFSTLLQSQYDDAGKCYVSSDRAKAMFGFAQDIVTAFFARGIDQYGGDSTPMGMPIGDIVANTINWLNYDTESFVPNVREIQARYDR